MKKNFWFNLIILLSLLNIDKLLNAGVPVAIECKSITTTASTTRLIMTIPSAVQHQIFTLDNPERVIIDLTNASLSGTLPQTNPDDPLLRTVRSGIRDEGELRIVLDLKQAVRVKSQLTGAKNAIQRDLIIDLFPANNSNNLNNLNLSENKPGSNPETQVVKLHKENLIAIDAGHGGKDPGAIGPSGTKEKDITLAIARKLNKLINQESAMHAVLIRDGDEFIPLRERMLRARQHQADLFISLHADAYNNIEARGSSVYTLSLGEASSEAANWLAKRENSADRIGGINLTEADEGLANVLIDMTQSATIEHSALAANAILNQLGERGVIHRNEVQRAGFVVLKAADIPSLLIETAFISNQGEEQRLRSDAYQQRLAQAIFIGIKDYFKNDASGIPLNNLLINSSTSQNNTQASNPATIKQDQNIRKQHEHIIAAGDSLAKLAARYQISIEALKTKNNLTDKTVLQIGQILIIPDNL